MKGKGCMSKMKDLHEDVLNCMVNFETVMDRLHPDVPEKEKIAALKAYVLEWEQEVEQPNIKDQVKELRKAVNIHAEEIAWEPDCMIDSFEDVKHHIDMLVGLV